MITRTLWNHCAIVAAAVVVAGCKRSEPVSTSVPEKQPVSEAPAKPAALPAGHPPIDMSAQSLPAGAAADAPNPQWTAPQQWQEGNPSSVRRASFAVNGADGQTVDIAVTVFPGSVGGLMMNINRWRGQIGLAPVTADEISALTSDVDINGIKSTTVDFTGDKLLGGKTQPQRVIVVIIPHEGNSWFFKMAGDAPLVEAQKETFLQFVKSVKF